MFILWEKHATETCLKWDGNDSIRAPLVMGKRFLIHSALKIGKTNGAECFTVTKHCSNKKARLCNNQKYERQVWKM